MCLYVYVCRYIYIYIHINMYIYIYIEDRFCICIIYRVGTKNVILYRPHTGLYANIIDIRRYTWSMICKVVRFCSWGINSIVIAITIFIIIIYNRMYRSTLPHRSEEDRIKYWYSHGRKWDTIVGNRFFFFVYDDLRISITIKVMIS